MHTSNLLACNDPDALVGWILRWGAGCPHRATLPFFSSCPHCPHTSSYAPLSRRKARLIACACCRFLWDRLDQTARDAVGVGERFAEGQSIVAELNAAYLRTACDLASCVVRRSEDEIARLAVERARDRLDQEFAPYQLADVIRDLVDDPGAPAVVRASWLDADGGQARAIAECIDLEGRFEDVPVLGDALEDAGCDDAKILAHARRGRHYRGCWLVDAILGKS